MQFKRKERKDTDIEDPKVNDGTTRIEDQELDDDRIREIEEKYDIEPEMNRPALVYGPPEYFRKKNRGK